MKRIAIISDSHSGHKFGLCPPDWQSGKFRKLQKQLWDWFARTAADCGAVDVLVCNGDMIDGNGEKSGGTELITTDRLEQAEMAAQAIRCFDAKRTFVVAGTGYHSGTAEEFERPVADAVGGSYVGEAFFRAEGVNVHCRHHIGTAQMPQSKGTALLRAQLMDALAASVGPGGDRADVIVRSHAHSFLAVANDFGLAFVTDGLQLRSRYGRRLDGWSDVGLLVLDVDGEDVSWTRHRFNPPTLARAAEVIG